MVWLFVLAIDFAIGLAVGLIKKRKLASIALTLVFLWPLCVVVGWDAWEGCFTTNIYWQGCGTAFSVLLFPIVLPAGLVVMAVGYWPQNG